MVVMHYDIFRLYVTVFMHLFRWAFCTELVYYIVKTLVSNPDSLYVGRSIWWKINNFTAYFISSRRNQMVQSLKMNSHKKVSNYLYLCIIF